MAIIFQKYYFQETSNLELFGNEHSFKTIDIIDKLYDLYASKIFGFILSLTNSKEEAESYLCDVFQHIANNQHGNGDLSEKKILVSVLLVCKRLYQVPFSVNHPGTY